MTPCKVPHERKHARVKDLMFSSTFDLHWLHCLLLLSKTRPFNQPARWWYRTGGGCSIHFHVAVVWHRTCTPAITGSLCSKRWETSVQHLTSTDGRLLLAALGHRREEPVCPWGSLICMAHRCHTSHLAQGFPHTSCITMKWLLSFRVLINAALFLPIVICCISCYVNLAPGVRKTWSTNLCLCFMQ